MSISKKLLGGGSIYRASSLYPQCKIFNCTKPSISDKTICCRFCAKRSKCTWPCLNDPDKCSMCVYPEGKERKDFLEYGTDS